MVPGSADGDRRPAVAIAITGASGAVYATRTLAALLVYEQSLVSADDLSQVKRAFDLNGFVGILYLIVLAVSIYVE